MNIEDKLNTAFAGYEYLKNELSREWSNNTCNEADDIFTKIEKVAVLNGVDSSELSNQIYIYVSKIEHLNNPNAILNKLNLLLVKETENLKFEYFEEFEDAIDRIGCYGDIKKLDLLLRACPIPQDDYQQEYLNMVNHIVGKLLLELECDNIIQNRLAAPH